MSVAMNTDRVADIQPLHHIQTVQVEVEPEGTRDSGEEELVAHRDRPQDIPPPAQGSPVSADIHPPEPPATADIHPPEPPSTHTPVPDIKNEGGVAGLGRFSPPSLPTVSEGLQEAGRKAAFAGKKQKKSKPLSTKDLLPLHKDVGRSTKQLLEPSTPEFKPTAEWVSVQWNPVTIGTMLSGCCTVEPVYNSHHWDHAKWLLYSGTCL